MGGERCFGHRAVFIRRTGTFCIGELTVDGDVVAITQAVALFIGEGDGCALFDSPLHRSSCAVIVGESSEVVEHGEGVVASEGHITCDEDFAADVGVLDDRLVEEIDGLTGESSDIDGALSGNGERINSVVESAFAHIQNAVDDLDRTLIVKVLTVCGSCGCRT